MKKINNKYIYIFIAVFFLIILFEVGITYSFLTVKMTGDEDNENTLFNSSLSQLTIASSNSFSFENAMPGTNTEYIFKVKNTGNEIIDSYKLFFSNVINTFEKKEEIKYSVSCVSSSGTCNGTNLIIFPNSPDLILEQGSIDVNVVHTYTITIEFIETNASQSYNQGKIIDFSISINNITGNLLANKIIENAGGERAIEAKGTPNFNSLATTDEGLYRTTDQDGNTFYFRGNVKNNYVSFANQIWRIVRVNGDGSIRLVLNDYATDGTSAYTVKYNKNANCDYVSSTHLSDLAECSKYGRGDYVEDSIATVVDEWFNNNITDDDLMYIKQDGKFCNDYSYTINSSSSYVQFGARDRLVNQKSPSLTCNAPSGYTNGSAETLYLPNGLLTADEVALAGGLMWQTNTNNYLYLNNNDWWTMSAYDWSINYQYLYFFFGGNASISSNPISNKYYIRPVINLKSSTTVTGSGTESDPYVIISASASLRDRILLNEGGVDAIENKVTPNFNDNATTDEGMYATNDQDGKVYYYRGAVKDNYVSFDNKMWRIVRINGDGTIRLILNSYAMDGTSTYTVAYNSSTGCGSGVSDSATAVECSKYGFGNYASGSVANYVNEWFNNNISNESLPYIKQTAKYCNDLTYLETTGNTRFGYTNRKTNPNLRCGPTYTNISGEAKTLYLPVGLLSVDEIAFAGGSEAMDNNSFYLYLNSTGFHTMSPYFHNPSTYYLYNYMYYNASLTGNLVSYGRTIRPVINIYGSLFAQGSGTEDDPYIIID